MELDGLGMGWRQAVRVVCRYHSRQNKEYKNIYSFILDSADDWNRLPVIWRGTPMHYSGLVVTLSDPGRREEVSRELRATGRIVVGERHGCRLTAALEARSAEEAEYWHGWVGRLPGVGKLDIALVAFDQEPTRINQPRVAWEAGHAS
jgi:hypothetical protein